MRAIQLESQVGPDGALHLSVPVGADQANSRVIVTIERVPGAAKAPLDDRANGESLYGSCAGLGLEEPADLPLPPLPSE